MTKHERVRFVIRCIILAAFLYLLAALGASREAQAAEPVRINAASEQQLQQLKRVGPATAKRIIEAREEQKFSSCNDATRVKGIGPKTVEAWGATCSAE